MSNSLSKHPSLIYSQDINTICQPLNMLGISYFAHARITNGEFSVITNNPGFAQHYLSHKYYNADIHLADNNQLGKYVLWDAMKRYGQSEKMHSEAREFGVQHTFTLIEKNAGYSDYYHFANNLPSQTINQVYLSNFELLQLFVQHFNNHVSQSKKLSTAYQLKFQIDESNAGFEAENIESMSLSQKEKFDFIQSLLIDKNNPHSELSPRQKECLFYLLKGMTMKEISRQLNLSPKTIEHYIENLKIKFNCIKRSDLIAKAWALGLWKIFT